MKELANLLIDFKDRILKDGRSSEFKQIAREKGFDFKFREKFADQAYAIKEFKLFKNKHARRLRGIISREADNGKARHRMYDFWTNNDMEESKTTVIELYHQELRLSTFEIRPKRMIKWAKEIIGREQKQYEELASFNSFYEIIAGNPRNVTHQLNETFLDAISTQKKIRVEGDGNYLLVYFKNKQIPIRELMDIYDFALDLQELLLNPNSGSGEEYV